MNPPAPSGATGLTEAGRRQLLASLEHVAAVARRLRPIARFLALLATLSALWLAFEIQSWTGASNLVAGIVLFILGIPALVCGWLWWLMVDIIDLPQVAARALGILRPPPDAAAQSAKVGEVFQMGGSLKQALKLAWEVDSLRGVIVGVLVLANPLFLALVGFSLVGSVVLGVVAALTGFFVLVF